MSCRQTLFVKYIWIDERFSTFYKMVDRHFSEYHDHLQKILLSN